MGCVTDILVPSEIFPLRFQTKYIHQGDNRKLHSRSGLNWRKLDILQKTYSLLAKNSTAALDKTLAWIHNKCDLYGIVLFNFTAL